MRSKSSSDIVVALCLILIGGIGLYGSMLLGDTALEPVGPAPVPRWTAIAIIVLALAVLAGAFRSRPADDAVPVFTRRPGLALVSVALLAIYILLMQLGWAGFRLASGLYLFTLGLTLTGWRWRLVPLHAAIALVLSFGSYYLFTEVLFIDLPAD